MEYMAMIRPSYNVGSVDSFFKEDNDEDAIVHAHGLIEFGEMLIGVYRIEGRNGIPIWRHDIDVSKDAK